MTWLSRARYAALSGPTTGDRIRLADTDLFIEIIEDRSGGPGLAGDEAVFGVDVAGGDKVPRKGGPGVTYSDLLVAKKTDLAPLVGADLGVMRRDAAAARGDRPTVLISLTDDPSAGPVRSWVREQLRVAQAV